LIKTPPIYSASQFNLGPWSFVWSVLAVDKEKELVAVRVGNPPDQSLRLYCR